MTGLLTGNSNITRSESEFNDIQSISEYSMSGGVTGKIENTSYSNLCIAKDNKVVSSFTDNSFSGGITGYLGDSSVINFYHFERNFIFSKSLFVGTCAGYIDENSTGCKINKQMMSGKIKIL